MNYLPTYSSKEVILRAVCLHNSYIHESNKRTARQIVNLDYTLGIFLSLPYNLKRKNFKH